MGLVSNNIEDILFQEGKINENQLSAIKLESANSGVYVEEIIRKRNLVDETELSKAKAKSLGVEYIDPSTLTIDSETLDLISAELAKKYLSVPFDLKKGLLHLAMADPLDIPSIEILERKTGYKIKPYLSLPDKIQKTIISQYGKSIGKDISDVLGSVESENTTKLEENLKSVNEANSIVQDSSVARVVSIILEYAVKIGASDVHIEPNESTTRVRYRIDGILQEKLSKIPKSSHDSIVARIKILSDLKIDEKRRPQDGRFKIEIANQKVDLRVSTLPTIYGEKVVIRLLKEQSRVFKLNELGLRGLALKNFERNLLKPNGIILVTGPTGSGKTVTLATAISKIMSVRINIMTLEDPVEIRIDGVNQVQINTQAGLTFASGLRAFLRQDPDVIMVGEIRDGETANLAVQAALTGHLVLATLHTNSAAGSIPRLLDMGIESFLLSSTMNAVLAQRLVRKICPFCKERYKVPNNVIDNVRNVLGGYFNEGLISLNASVPIPDLNKNEKDELDATADFEKKVSQIELKNLPKATEKVEKLYLYRGKGCDKCNNTGYKGRIGIFEVLDVNEKESALINQQATSDVLEKEGVQNGMITLLQDGYIKALEGITTLEEVMRVSNE